MQVSLPCNSGCTLYQLGGASIGLPSFSNSSASPSVIHSKGRIKPWKLLKTILPSTSSYLNSIFTIFHVFINWQVVFFHFSSLFTDFNVFIDWPFVFFPFSSIFTVLDVLFFYWTVVLFSCSSIFPVFPLVFFLFVWKLWALITCSKAMCSSEVGKYLSTPWTLLVYLVLYFFSNGQWNLCMVLISVGNEI